MLMNAQPWSSDLLTHRATLKASWRLGLSLLCLPLYACIEAPSSEPDPPELSDARGVTAPRDVGDAPDAASPLDVSVVLHPDTASPLDVSVVLHPDAITPRDVAHPFDAEPLDAAPAPDAACGECPSGWVCDEEGRCRACSALQIEELWIGHYSESMDFIYALDPAAVGTTLEVEETPAGEALRVTWSALIYEDCQTPTAAVTLIEGDALSVSFSSCSPCSCSDTDLIANVSTLTYPPPGLWRVYVGCVSGFRSSSCEPIEAEVEIGP